MNKIVQYNYKSIIQSKPKPSRTNIPKKRALLVGINYENTKYRLKGCINDVNNISNILTQKGYTCVKITDQTSMKPTKANILLLLQQLLTTSVSGDTCFFHYSGHGTSTMDRNKDELDGRDEMICPLDMNFILDDELNSLIRKYLPAGVTLFALFDSCFSGTVLDLKYNYLPHVMNSRVKETNSNVIMISGCSDSQLSADAWINNNWQGAMTNSFINSLPSSTSLVSLLQKMRTYLFKNKYTQIPQMSTGRLVNINLPNLYV
jgi:hypothetical protein